MSIFSKLHLRPIEEGDLPQLELFRKNYWEANLELPWGYKALGVETCVAEKSTELIGSLTATGVVVLDFVHNPASSGPDVFAAVLAMERALTYEAQKNGFTTSYVAIPKQLTSYIDMVKRCNYQDGFEDCVILRRQLRKSSVPSLGDERGD